MHGESDQLIPELKMDEDRFWGYFRTDHFSVQPPPPLDCCPPPEDGHQFQDTPKSRAEAGHLPQVTDNNLLPLQIRTPV